jgi:hypothetical protein
MRYDCIGMWRWGWRTASGRAMKGVSWVLSQTRHAKKQRENHMKLTG